MTTSKEVLQNENKKMKEALKEIEAQNNYSGFGEPSSRLVYVMQLAVKTLNEIGNAKKLNNGKD